MSVVLDGSPASEGIAAGPVFLLEWGIPHVAHQSISDEGVEDEILRFDEARRWALERLQEIKEQTEARLGPVEARIFDPQLLMLEDVEVVDEEPPRMQRDDDEEEEEEEVEGEEEEL